MTLEQLYVQDQARFKSQLQSAQTPDKAQIVLENELDRLLYRYNEGCENALVRQAASTVLQQLRISASLTDAIAESEVYEKRSSSNRSKPGMRSKLVRTTVLLTAGGILLGLSAISQLLPRTLFRIPGSGFINLLFILSGGTLLYLGGRLSSHASASSRGNAEYHVEHRVNADQISATMLAALMSADRDLKTFQSISEQALLSSSSSADALSTTPSDGRSSLSEDQLELISQLLEALYSGNGNLALSRIEQLRFFLHRSGIELEDMTDETREHFDLIPSSSAGTIRPALICNGQLLRRGLAGHPL